MLELRNIKKDYETGGSRVHALKNISLKFRDSEFVAILGPSGCGKTTMLNIIGGLDKYTTGDLLINNISTKNYKERDWDNYRNHSIGFVFQSYNLISHQTVLRNVELALTLAGVSKKERKKRAIEALKKVGLGDQLKKKPSEMSGGQMQRVAIARAIVNDPDIILADEPTGALDTETSIQVMNILKEISKERLIIMVTHNPDLAKKYATRTVKMLDGKILSDSKPINKTEENKLKKVAKEKVNSQSKKRASMKLHTAFGLSLNNLFTKKGRTLLTSFAGSIGIIGISLIFAVSQGTTNYINAVQEDTLSVYPLTIEESNTDLSSLMETFMNSATSSNQHERDAVYQKMALYNLSNALNNLEADSNDLKAFKTYIDASLEDEESELANAISGVKYSYNLDLLVYTKNVDNEIIRSDVGELTNSIMKAFWNVDTSQENILSSNMLSSIMGGASTANYTTIWQEMLDGKNGEIISPLLEQQYDVIYGSWPQAYNEIVLVVDSNNEIDDMTLYAIGLKSREEIDNCINAALNGEQLEETSKSWSYQEITNQKYKIILNSDCYVEENGNYIDLRETEAGLQYLYNNGLDLKITGIIRPNESASATMLSGSIAYTHQLTNYVIEKMQDSASIKAQLANKNMDILTGKLFKNSDTLTAPQKAEIFDNYLEELGVKERADTYRKIKAIIDENILKAQVNATLATLDIQTMRMTLINAFTTQYNMGIETATKTVNELADEDITALFEKIIEEQIKTQYAETIATSLAGLSDNDLATALAFEATQYNTETKAKYYDEVIEFSSSTYEKSLNKLGYVDLDTPSSISFYASSFENKDAIVAAIDKYNEDVDEVYKISYTDFIGILLSSITTIINAITYVLIAFVSISLIVSSIMIGVITLISVQERTKEIGILRAIGASKKNVSSMFNAETVIIGFASGALGIGITYLLCIPINLILHSLTDIDTLNATLPWQVAVILVIISMLLTLISGIIPSKSAAKKDPVIALRTE